VSNGLNQLHYYPHTCEGCGNDAWSCECPGAYLYDGSFQPSLDANNNDRTLKLAAVLCDPQGRKRVSYMCLSEALHELNNFPVNWYVRNLDTSMTYRNDKSPLFKTVE
jgi:hypothetical protein